MNYFDLHCDTILKCFDKGVDIENCGFDVSLDKADVIDNYTQVFAIFMREKYQGAEAKEAFSGYLDYFGRQTISKGPHILSIENAGNIITCPEDAARLSRSGVRIASLTWNADNPLASGCEGSGGLSELGRMAAVSLEGNGVVLDISHLSDRGSEELFELSDLPIIATHSNARRICRHKRNLDDWQIKEIIRRKGLIGINFYTIFLCDNGGAGITDLVRHCGYMLEMGAEKTLAMGSDFDGCVLPDFLSKGLSDVGTVYTTLCREFSAAVADDIFFNNAHRFFCEKVEL